MKEEADLFLARQVRISPLSRAVFPTLMFFLSVILVVVILEEQSDSFFGIFFAGLNLLFAYLWIRMSYQSYMEQYWFRQVILTGERHKKHIKDGAFVACTCIKRLGECITEWRRHS